MNKLVLTDKLQSNHHALDAILKRATKKPEPVKPAKPSKPA